MDFFFKKLIIVGVILLLLAGIGWGWRWYKALTASNYKDLLNALYSNSVPRLQPIEITQLEEFIVLDTRSTKEYQVSHLSGAKLVNYKAPDWEQLEQLDKNQAILVYCSVGYRSERIGEVLLERGFTKVYNLYGGIFEWINQNRPVVNETGQMVQTVHGYAPRWGKWVTAPVEVSYD